MSKIGGSFPIFDPPATDGFHIAPHKSIWRRARGHVIIAGYDHGTPPSPHQHGSFSGSRAARHGKGRRERAWPVDARAVAASPDAGAFGRATAVRPPPHRVETAGREERRPDFSIHESRRPTGSTSPSGRTGN